MNFAATEAMQIDRKIKGNPLNRFSICHSRWAFSASHPKLQSHLVTLSIGMDLFWLCVPRLPNGMLEASSLFLAETIHTRA